MTDEKVYAEPSDVEAEHGVVSVAGPDAVDVRLTPDAARETSDRLLKEAMRGGGSENPQSEGSGLPAAVTAH